MQLTPRRRGLFRVAGGFNLTTAHLSILVSWRPEPIGWGLARQLDYNGYRYLRLGRLLVAVAHAFTKAAYRRIAERQQEIVAEAAPVSSIAERTAPYTMKARP